MHAYDQSSMHAYDQSKADIVKSVQQRWLLAFWARNRNGAMLPTAGAFCPDTIESCRDDLTILDVLPHNAAHRFRIFDHGKNIGAMYAGQCNGKYLDEVLPDAARARTLETYERAVLTKVPIYTVSQLTDSVERPILYERLLLPLGDSDGRVVRIMALLETISTEGAIERRNLMTDPELSNGYIVRAELQVRPG